MGASFVTPIKSKEEFLSKFSQDATEEYYDAFVKRFNDLAGEKGHITEAEWNESFKDASPTTKEIMQTVWHLADTDKNAQMSLDEFLMIYGFYNFGTMKQKLEACFALYDTSRDGKLELAELEECLRFLSRVTIEVNIKDDKEREAKKPQLEEQVKTLAKGVMDLVDTDKSGTIEFNEFSEAFEKYPNLKDLFPLLFD